MHANPISINQVTVYEWDLRDAADQISRIEGIDGIGLWPDKIAEIGGAEAAWKIVHDAGLVVSSIVFVANFTKDLRRAVERGKRAIDECAALHCDTLAVVAGPRVVGDEDDRTIRRGLEELAHRARHMNVTMALEPWHPMDRDRYSSVTTLDQALRIVEGLPATAIVLDLWHVWQDPHLDESLRRAAGWIRLVQVADWQEPSTELADRLCPGDGVMPLEDVLPKVDAIGYSNWYEVELFSTRNGSTHYPELLRRCVAGMRRALAYRGEAAKV